MTRLLEPPDPGWRVILIGGTSHLGKSTAAQRIAAVSGWSSQSTDKLSRHPGRPWGPIPPQVMQHYLKLSVEELMASVLAHYRGMKPAIEACIDGHLRIGEKLVLEGSALLPETINALRSKSMACILLHADDRLIEERILMESVHAEQSLREQTMIENFIARAKAFNRFVVEDATARGLPLLHVEADTNVDAFADRCLASMRSLA